MEHPGVALLVWAGGLAVFVLIGGSVWWILRRGGDRDNFAALALFVLVGLAAFIGLLNFLSFSAHYIGIVDARQPFGLPDGSIRAILTVAFIVLVGVLASFLLTHSGGRQPFASGEAGKIEIAKGIPLLDAQGLQQRLSADGLVAVVPVTPAPAPPTFDVHFYPRQDYRLADDVSKQVLTILSTILAAMIGFYFGARTDTAGQGASEAAERLRISADLNTVAMRDPTLETIRTAAAVKAAREEAKKPATDAILKEVDETQKKLDDARAATGDLAAPIDKVRTARDQAKDALSKLKDIDQRLKAM